MDKALYVGNSMIVPVDTLDLSLLQDIFKHPSSNREYDQKDFQGKLTKMLPDFRDEHIPEHNPHRSWQPEFYGEGVELRTEIEYDVLLQKGRARVKMLLAEDLRTYCSGRIGYDFKLLLGDERGEPIMESLSGKSGVVVEGQYQRGRSDGQGLYLGVNCDSIRKSLRGALDNIPNSMTQRVLNTLCESKPLRLTEGELPNYSPLSFVSREIRANMKDLRVEKLKEAEPHIHEFFSWISSQAQEIQTILVMGNLYRSFAHWEDQLRKLQESKKINLKQMPNHAAQTLDIIAGMMNDLHPPHNRRMEYLVHD